jgi:propionyl-CoA carboxylase alpha chain
MVTGLDLVEIQIRIAMGEELPFKQEDLSLNGHSIELRVYAEDPFNQFMPSIGTLTRYEPPTGEGVRVDDGYEQGMSIPIYYDPMIAKLAVHGSTRAEAIQKMLQAIREYRIEGVQTTLPFGTFVMEHEAFVSGRFDTHFVPTHYLPEKIREKQRLNAEMAALVALRDWKQRSRTLTVVEQPPSNWKRRSSI